MKTFLLLLASNIFMTVAWYGHLRRPDWPMGKAIAISWGIALVEYCLMVPANRIGYGRFTAYQLKVMQEAITLAVFIAFALVWLKESPRWNHGVAFLLIFAAAFFAFLPAKGS